MGSSSLKAILDTSILIATDVSPLEGELAISAASLAELHLGVLITADLAIRAERLRRLSDLQRTFDALPVDDDVATSYGELAAALAAARSGSSGPTSRSGRRSAIPAVVSSRDRGDEKDSFPILSGAEDWSYLDQLTVVRRPEVD